jgi:ABC-type multidrug transport system ATPase subunit
MRFLFGLADTVSVIHWGQVIAAGTPDELRRQPLGAALQPRRAGDAGRGGRGSALMLRLERVETFYGETQALFGVSLEVGRGEVVALLGANGAGKTTLLRSVLGLTPARRGRIEFAGRDITRAPTHEIARAGIGWVPDDRRVFPDPHRGAQPGDRAQEDRRFAPGARRTASPSSAPSST